MTTLKNSIGLRLGIIGIVTLVLLIPALMIQSLISERQSRRDMAIQEVFEKWGREQNISGPVLTVPFKEVIKYPDGKSAEIKKYVHLLPNELNADGTLFPEIRYRGIYETVLYNSQIKIAGNFSPAVINELNIRKENLLWNEAFLSVGISDLKGIKELVKVKWKDDTLNTNPGIPTKQVLASGVSTPVNISDSDTINFQFNINLNGSENITFTPVGKETNIKLQSKWGSPSFTGEFLPVKRIIKEDHFSAEWNVLHLNRNYPQMWIGDSHQINGSEFGVKLLVPVDEYQKTMRTAKYAIMFIALTFITFFMIELLNKKLIHPIQYLLIGFALLIFYSLLLAVSEHLLFNYAYFISSILIIGLITAYTCTVLKSNLHAILIAAILALLYFYLFVILQLQDYALLMGSIGLFVILGLIMFITRKVDWFGIMRTDTKKYNE